MEVLKKINMMTTVYQTFPPPPPLPLSFFFYFYSFSSFSILIASTKIFLFCSEPIKKKRIFMEYNSNLHNMLRFCGCMFSVRETENPHKFSPKIILQNITALNMSLQFQELCDTTMHFVWFLQQ